MENIDREYWKAFENYDSLKFNFVARKAFKDLPSISTDIETDVLTGRVSASGSRGFISYDLTIQPTNEKKFKIEAYIRAKLGDLLPEDLPKKLQLHIITSQILEKKLKKILPEIECNPYIYKPKSRKTLREIFYGEETVTPENKTEWTIECNIPPEKATMDSFEKGVKIITDAIKNIEKSIDPEAIFYKAWNTWRELNIYLPEEEAKKKMEKLMEKSFSESGSET